MPGSKRKLDKKDEPDSKKAKTEKPALTHDWTRTDPKTGELGRLQRKDQRYLRIYRKNQTVVDKKKKKRAKQGAKAAEKASPKKSPQTNKKKTSKDKEEEAKEESEEEEEGFEYWKRTKRYKGFVAIVTGGGRGIGQAIALRLAQEGAHVYVWDNKRWKETEKLVRESVGHDDSCDGMKVNCCDIKEVKSAINAILKDHGFIDVLINAPYDRKTRDGELFVNTTLRDHQDVIDKQYYAPLNIIQEIIPHMQKESFGRIVTIVSQSSYDGMPHEFAYGAAKSGLVAAIRVIAREHAKDGITLNCIAAGTMADKIESIDPPVAEAELNKIPMKRFPENDELAGLVAFVASEENSYTTGHVYDFSGGKY